MNWTQLSIKRPVFITCIVVLMLVMGVFSLKKMSVDLFPDVTFPVLFIQATYKGASPTDVEKQIGKPVEDELSSLSGLKKISTTAADGAAIVVMEFAIGTDIKEKEQEVRQRLGNIRRELPVEMEEPIVRRFDPSDQAIVNIALSSDMPADELFDLANEKIKPQFDTITGVGQVDILGGRKREIKVDVDLAKLQDRQMSMLQVVQKIQATSKDVPIGKVDEGKQETSFRATGEFANLEALKSVNVNFIGSDQVVKLNEIANVYSGLEEEKTEATFAAKHNGFERKSALFIQVFKQSGANTVDVSDLVTAKLDVVNTYLQEKNIKASVYKVRDASRPIRLNIADVRESILIGIVLCVIVVYFFLGSARSTFITGMALPNSLLGGFVIMYMMGFSINIMTLLALSLAVGLLIDDAIVVRENIFRHLEMGKSPTDAAIEGTKEVTMAVIATTLVVIAVFGPIAFLQGIVGQFFKQFGLTIVFTMLISTFDAFTVAPMLSAKMASANEHERSGPFAGLLNIFDRFQNWLENWYEKILLWTLSNRMKTIALATVFFFGSLFLTKYIPKTFLPTPDNQEFQITIEKPVGTTLAETRELVRRIEQEVQKNTAIELVATTIGKGQSVISESNRANLYIHLVPRKERAGTTSVVKEEVRATLAPFQKEAIINIGDIDISGGDQKVFNLNVTGENLEELTAYVEKLKPRLEKIDGLVDVDTNYRTGKPEYHIEFERNKSEALGVSTATAGAELRARIEGEQAGIIRENGVEYNIKVRLQGKDRDLRSLFDQMVVPNTNFNMIPLRNIARGVEKNGYSQINRQNKGRYINLSANLGPKGSLGNITTEVENLLKNDPEYKLPSTLSYRFMGQAEDFKDLLNNMLIAMGLGILFIYLVLASLYESFITPFTILLALPLAVVGAMLALFVTQKSIDLFSLIGIIMLLGVVAKNSILLVDYMNQQLEAGMDRTKAILLAGRTRLRPILMTSFALIGGTIPIAIGLNEASAQRTSMGIAIIGGLISSTVLTLIVVPAAFGYVDDFRRKVLPAIPAFLATVLEVVTGGLLVLRKAKTHGIGTSKAHASGETVPVYSEKGTNHREHL
jgi:HAE1 family hydrophobic/amphiphilic exporter-1